MIPASDTAMASSPDDKAPVEALILNGIDEFLRRSDLIDRSVVLKLPPIAEPDRRDAALFWEAFQRDRPRMLGGLLDAVVGGLRELPSVELTKLPRMAGFARFAEAVGRNLGWQPESTLPAAQPTRAEPAPGRPNFSRVGPSHAVVDYSESASLFVTSTLSQQSAASM